MTPYDFRPVYGKPGVFYCPYDPDGKSTFRLLPKTEIEVRVTDLEARIAALEQGDTRDTGETDHGPTP